MNKPLASICGKVVELPTTDLSFDNNEKFEARLWSLFAEIEGFQGWTAGACFIPRYTCEFATDIADADLLRLTTEAYCLARKTWRQGVPQP